MKDLVIISWCVTRQSVHFRQELLDSCMAKLVSELHRLRGHSAPHGHIRLSFQPWSRIRSNGGGHSTILLFLRLLLHDHLLLGMMIGVVHGLFMLLLIVMLMLMLLLLVL